MSKIVLIDDDESTRETLITYLSEIGYDIEAAENGKKGIDLVKRSSPDMVICDIKMPDINGLEVLKVIKEYDNLIQVIMITAFDDMTTTITAMQYGAYDYLEKPVDITRLKMTITRALENRQLSKKLESLEPQDSKENELFNVMIGKSQGMREIYKKIGQASATKVTVLIQGESGTGKELIARIIHSSGITKEQPFIAVNCTALPDNLLESELFGHVKGSFTDAIKDKKGKFELAGEGTIFLDEISEMSLNLQAKLLRVLQEHTFERVGGENTLSMKARVITATNSNIIQLVENGKFREDLYYRLNVFAINPPSLRERQEDIEMLVRHFLRKINFTLHKNVTKVPEDVMKMLIEHKWFGNVRELENTLMQAVVLSKGDVLEKANLLLKKADKQRGNSSPDDILENNFTLSDLERTYIQNMLTKYDWNVKYVAKILGIGIATLYRKMEQYEIVEPEQRKFE